MRIGCILPGTLRNGLPLLQVQAFCRLPATGILIIVAVRIDKMTGGKEGEHG
jgi:ribose transport system permease protein